MAAAAEAAAEADKTQNMLTDEGRRRTMPAAHSFLTPRQTKIKTNQVSGASAGPSRAWPSAPAFLRGACHKLGQCGKPRGLASKDAAVDVVGAAHFLPP